MQFYIVDGYVALYMYQWMLLWRAFATIVSSCCCCCCQRCHPLAPKIHTIRVSEVILWMKWRHSLLLWEMLSYAYYNGKSPDAHTSAAATTSPPPKIKGWGPCTHTRTPSQCKSCVLRSLLLESAMEIRFAINGNVLIVLEARTCCVNSKMGSNNNNNGPRKSIVYDVNIMSAAARLRFIQNEFMQRRVLFDRKDQWARQRGGDAFHEWMTQFSNKCLFLTFTFHSN